MSNAPTAREIRLFCDGELPPQEAAVVEAKLREHAEPRARAEFERRLRERVGAVLKAGSAPPAGLADRIREAMTSEEAWASRDPQAGIIGTIEPPSAEPAPHRAWWRGPTRANAYAVAASVVLVAGAVLFGIFGRPIDSWPGRGTIDVAAEAAAAVASEHVMTANSPAGPAHSARYRTRDQAASGLTEYLGAAGLVYDLSDLGYAFLGGDTCDVPRCERGCHLIYRRTGDGPGLVTLHVVPRPRQFELHGSPGLQTFPILTDKITRNQDCPKDVLVWSHGEHCYMLVVSVAQDAEKIALRMQQTLLAGAPHGTPE